MLSALTSSASIDLLVPLCAEYIVSEILSPGFAASIISNTVSPFKIFSPFTSVIISPSLIFPYRELSAVTSAIKRPVILVPLISAVTESISV